MVLLLQLDGLLPLQPRLTNSFLSAQLNKQPESPNFELTSIHVIALHAFAILDSAVP